MDELIELIIDKILFQLNAIDNSSSYQNDETVSNTAEHLAKTLYYLTNSPHLEHYLLTNEEKMDELDELLD